MATLQPGVPGLIPALRRAGPLERMLASRKGTGFREVFLRHPQPMWIYDIETLRFLDVNEAACAAYGYSRPDFLRMTIAQIRPPENRAMHRERLHAHRNEQSASSALRRHRRANGATFYADIASSDLEFGGKNARIVLAIDASARIAVSRALAESRAALAEAQALAHLGSYETDFATGERRWSAELFRILGVDPARERPSSLYAFDHLGDRAAVTVEVERARKNRTSYAVEHRIITRDGRERHVFEHGQFFYDARSTEPNRVVGAIQDITERKSSEEQLRTLANHDALTDLPNRMLLRAHLEGAIERARERNGSVGVYFVDLDRFKTINDTIAHAAGDRLLRELAKRLTRIVGTSGMIARHGGDEFIVVLDDIPDDLAGIAAAYELLGAIAEPLPYGDTTLGVTASIGLARFPRDGETPDDLLRNADAAMSAAKARGGNAVDVYTARLHEQAVAERELERALRDALERDAIGVAYQPIVDAKTGRVVAFEALARWTESGREIPPSEFIPLAEESGLIVRLGTSVLERACREAVRLIRAGNPDLTMCVNISARQFRQRDFAGDVRRALDLTGLRAANLQLEITESAYISVDSGMRNIAALENVGVQLSIDDFGTGYSSLGYLKRLPVDALKIDRSFVSEILRDPADQAIVRAIIAVAQNLGLAVIAEGVETAGQAEYLRGLGCTQLQGFYFARPLPASELDAFLRQPSIVSAVYTRHESDSDRA